MSTMASSAAATMTAKIKWVWENEQNKRIEW